MVIVNKNTRLNWLNDTTMTTTTKEIVLRIVFTGTDESKKISWCFYCEQIGGGMQINIREIVMWVWKVSFVCITFGNTDASI